jgi:hypothetical protein
MIEGSVKFNETITRSSHPNPLWRSALKKGEVVIGPYSCSGTSISYGSWTGHTTQTLNTSQYEYECNSFPIGGTGSNGLNPSTPTTLDYDLESELMIEMAANVKTSSMMLPVTLAEAPKTWKLLADTFRTSANLLLRARNALHGDVKAARQLKELLKKFKDIEYGQGLALSKWLEWRYGWRQVMFDLENAADAAANLQRYQEGKLRQERARGEYRTSEIITLETRNTSSLQLATGFGTIVEKLRKTTSPIVVRGEAIGFYTISLIGEYHRQLGLNIVPTAYELTPFSFVLDWGVNLGQWLRAYTTVVPGLMWEGAQFGILRASEIKYEAISGGFTSATPSLFVTSGETVVKKFTFSRTEKSPTAVYLPTLSNGLTLMRAIDAVALFTGNAKGLRYDVSKIRI